MTVSSSRPRRPINPDALLPYVVQQKLARPIEASARRAVSISRAQLVPVVRAELGAEVPVRAYLYRLFIPVAQVIRESSMTYRHVTITTDDDIDTLNLLFIRDFEGATM